MSLWPPANYCNEAAPDLIAKLSRLQCAYRDCRLLNSTIFQWSTHLLLLSVLPLQCALGCQPAPMLAPG